MIRPPIPPRPSAFTLVELLVVITIIVVLLALLTPALDQAIYQAELTVCGGNFKSLGSGTLIYATANRRAYPARILENNWSPNRITAHSGADDRPIFRSYLSINDFFNDPFLPPLEFVNTSTTHPTIYADPELWFSFYLVGERPMRKIGDRWTTIDLAGDVPKKVYMDLLASDQDQIISDQGAGWATSSHPDRDGRMVVDRFQDVPLLTGGGLPTGTVAGATGIDQPGTYGYYITPPADGYQRSPVDYNYLFQDGSVRRYNSVTYDDPRMVKTEFLAPHNRPGTYELVPVQ